MGPRNSLFWLYSPRPFAVDWNNAFQKIPCHPRDSNLRPPSWTQLVAMLFCQLAQARSLREISEGLQAQGEKLKPLGLSEAPARSTLAYANGHRPWQLFETVFQQLLGQCQNRLGVAQAGAKLDLPGKLLSLDATVIDLCAAPGSKTAQLLEMLHSAPDPDAEDDLLPLPSGLLLANDSDAKRTHLWLTKPVT